MIFGDRTFFCKEFYLVNLQNNNIFMTKHNKTCINHYGAEALNTLRAGIQYIRTSILA